MGEFLSMLGVALIRIVGDERVIVDEEVGLPDGVGAVCCVGPPALGDVADKFPCACFIRAGVQVDTSSIVAGTVPRG